MLNRLVLILWLCLPSFIYVQFSLPSLAGGLLTTSMILFVCRVIFSKEKFGYFLPIGIRPMHWILLALASLSAILADLMLGQAVSAKQGLSVIALLVLFMQLPIIFNGLFSLPAVELEKCIRFAYAVMLSIGVIGILLPLKFGAYCEFKSPVFPFAEPSHYALAYLLVAAMMIPISSVRMRYFIIIAGALLAIGFPNATLLVGTLLLFLLLPWNAGLIFVAAAIIVLIMVGSYFSDYLSNYFLLRFTSAGSGNTSRLVYLQGWKAIYSAFDATSGLGIGFQNLGKEPANDATFEISRLTNAMLNRNDGSFLFAKLSGEFGLIGIIFCLGLTAFSIFMGFLVKRKLRNGVSICQDVFLIQACALYIFIVELMIRGVGYFSPTFILILYLMPSPSAFYKSCVQSLNGLSADC